VAVIALSLSLFSGCVRSKLPLANISVPLPTMEPIRNLFGSYREGNFQNRDWDDAFLAMHQKLTREYPFTEWKELDWDGLYEAWAPQVQAAMDAKDNAAYYKAIRSYLYAIPDAGININTQETYRNDAIGGDFGFSILPLDDGRIIVVRVEPGFFADMAGLEWGSEVIEWNGLPIAEALEQVPLLWGDAPAATRDCRILEQCALLTRAPIGAKALLKYKKPGSEALWTSRLEARRDFYRTLHDLIPEGKVISEFDAPFESRILDGNIGYINIHCHAATLVMPFPARAFRTAIEQFTKAEVKGIILDLRGNAGGQDLLAVEYAGHFTQSPLFYRNLVAFDYDKGGFALNEEESLTIEPKDPYFGGPVMVLIQHTTRDSGQALADSLHQLPNVALIGFSGTDGSWSYPGGQITMPGGYRVTYPIGRYLDSTNAIRIATTSNMKSRVTPDIDLPINMDTCAEFFLKNKDLVLQRAIEEIKARNK